MILAGGIVKPEKLNLVEEVRILGIQEGGPSLEADLAGVQQPRVTLVTCMPFRVNKHHVHLGIFFLRTVCHSKCAFLSSCKWCSVVKMLMLFSYPPIPIHRQSGCPLRRSPEDLTPEQVGHWSCAVESS